jgi:MFS family permease
LLRAGLIIESAGFFSLAVSPQWGAGALYLAGALIALGSGLITPSTSSYVSRRAGPAMVGLTLGVLQSAAALARSLGPASGGLVYQGFGHTAPYVVSGCGVLIAAVLTTRLPRTDDQSHLPVPASAASSPGTTT